MNLNSHPFSNGSLTFGLLQAQLENNELKEEGPTSSSKCASLIFKDSEYMIFQPIYRDHSMGIIERVNLLRELPTIFQWCSNFTRMNWPLIALTSPPRHRDISQRNEKNSKHSQALKVL